MKNFSEKEYNTTEDNPMQCGSENKPANSGNDDSGPFLKKSRPDRFSYLEKTFSGKKLRIIVSIGGMLFMFAMEASFCGH